MSPPSSLRARYATFPTQKKPLATTPATGITAKRAFYPKSPLQPGCQRLRASAWEFLL